MEVVKKAHQLEDMREEQRKRREEAKQTVEKKIELCWEMYRKREEERKEEVRKTEEALK